MSFKRLVWGMGFVGLGCLVGCKGCQEQAVGPLPNDVAKLSAMPRCDRRFVATDAPTEVRWRGADNGQTARLPDGRVIWVFSDSWVGKRKGKGRHEATIVRNTLAIQAKASCDSPVAFHWRVDAAKKPKAFFQPRGREGFFWPLGIAFDGERKKLLILCGRFKKNPTLTNVFDGVQPVESVLLIVDNPLDAPRAWRVREQLLAAAGSPVVQYGLRLWQDPKSPMRWLFLGSQERDGGKTAISLHRMSWKPQSTGQPGLSSMGSFQTLTPDGSWRDTLAAKRKILFEGASQTSVHFAPKAKRYVALYARGWEGIWMRISTSLSSGWSDATLLYRYPELRKGKDVFCGTLGVHLAFQNASGSVPLTYMCNSTHFFAMAGDMSLYVPIFLSLQLIQPSKGQK